MRFFGSTQRVITAPLPGGECFMTETSKSPNAVIASPLRRAADTAAAVARRFALPVEEDPRWMELDFGEWEGRRYDEIARTMDMPVGTLKARLHRARERLRGKLTRAGVAP